MHAFVRALSKTRGKTLVVVSVVVVVVVVRDVTCSHRATSQQNKPRSFALLGVLGLPVFLQQGHAHRANDHGEEEVLILRPHERQQGVRQTARHVLKAVILPANKCYGN